MHPKTKWYVALVTTLAVIAAAALWKNAPPVSASAATDALVLTVLALAAEGLAFVLPRSAIGTMAFIPYFSLAVIVPSWPSVLAVAILRSALELHARRPPIKAVFNVSEHALSQAIAILVYLALGGQPLATINGIAHFAHASAVVGAPVLIAGAAGFLSNNIAVTGVVAISSGRPLLRTWIDNNRATIGIDLLATPLVFVFAWVYATFGVIATATLWIPILGLRQLQRTNIELEQTNEELLELMVKSLEARDLYTSGHSRRVQQYSTIIARALGLSERQIDQVGRAALLHDVGKIHEKYAAVLAKDAKLTPEEWALIQEHPVDGANLVATMSRLRDVVPAIRGHHENWDGTGYPDGLAGDAIPLAARIIRFADTIDAMTSERPYRRPLTEGQVRAELIRCQGSQFDPDIAEKLLASAYWPALFATAAAGGAAAPRERLAVVGSKRHARSRVGHLPRPEAQRA